MAEFINTVDALGDDAVLDGIIQKTITEFKDNAVEVVGERAFQNCSALKDVELPLCAVIRNHAFNGCTSLKSVSAPKVTRIGNEGVHPEGRSFLDCKSLESVNFPLVIKTGHAAFMNCTSLKEVNLPLFDDSHSQNMFQNCTSIEKICLPSATYANNGFLWGCTSLKLIDLPSVKTMYGHMVIQDCPMLTALILRNTKETCVLSFETFTNTPIKSGHGYIYVPRALVDSYKAATNWSVYAAQIRALEDYTVDGTITGDLDESKI